MFKTGIISIFLVIITTFVDNTKGQTSGQTVNLYPQYSWKYLDFQFPNAAARDSAIKNRQYIKGNSFPIDIDVYYGGFVF